MTVPPPPEVAINNIGTNGDGENVSTRTTNSTNTEPCLDLSLTIGARTNRASPEPIIDLEDSASEADECCGEFDPLF